MPTLSVPGDWKELLDSVPENFRDDPIFLYFRCKYARQSELMAAFQETDRKKVQAELKRIAALKASFAKREKDERTENIESIKQKIAKAEDEKEKGEAILTLQALENSRTLSETLAHCREAWRVHAVESGREATMEIKKRFPDATDDLQRVKRDHQLQIRSKVGGKGWEKPSSTEPESSGSQEEDKGYGYKVYNITMKRDLSTQGLDKSAYSKYSIKTYPLSDVLAKEPGDDNILQQPCEDNTIRYFHFPANNMLWVEEAITRYCGETRGEYNYRKSPDYRTQSSNLLCREFWTGQQHGNISDPIHSRHMRSHCSYISSEQGSQNDATPKSRRNSLAYIPSRRTSMANAFSTANHLRAASAALGSWKRPSISQNADSAGAKAQTNFVIFMPYLHWEIDKRRRKMAEVMKQATQVHRKDLRKEFPHLDQEFQEKIIDAVDKVRKKHLSRISTMPLNGTKNSSSAGVDGTKSRPASSSSEDQPLKKHRNFSPWGEYLFHTAQIFEAMDIEPDVRMLSNHLHPKKVPGQERNDPPLHGRRTLDQSYYWKVEDTQRRDEDQVVYRGTQAGRSIFRTTRVIMVDQLWLYILDNNTILTFYPRRWGKNKPDFSGVHRGIRSKLEHLLPGEIQSVHDLALLIMNQCSAVFFDRTKPSDARPQVLDIFANAIAFVTEMKTIAFESFWWHLQRLHLDDPRKTDIEAIAAAARTYLDVNPEGLLIREAHDIMDELRMMGRVYSQQLRVATTFMKTLQELSEQEAPATDKELLQGMRRTLDTMNARQTGGSMDTDMHAIIPHHEEESFGPPRSIPDSTLYRARNLLDDIETRQKELQDLEDNTRDITDHLKELLTLKQQQASIIEARAALARAEESVAQGRAIMLFTIITIIFLPLSFMSSVFGMNAAEFSGPDGAVMPLKHQFKIMFPVSVGVILLSLAIAFSTWIRNFAALISTVTWVTILEYSGILRAWRWCTRGEKYDAAGLRLEKQRRVAGLYGRQEWKKNSKIRDEVNQKVYGTASIEGRRTSVMSGGQMNGNGNANGHGNGSTGVWNRDGRGGGSPV